MENKNGRKCNKNKLYESLYKNVRKKFVVFTYNNLKKYFLIDDYRGPKMKNIHKSVFLYYIFKWSSFGIINKIKIKYKKHIL